MECNNSVPIFIWGKELNTMEIIGAKPKRQKKKPYIFIGSIIVAVLVVIGIIAGALYMTHKQPTTNQINEEQQYQQLKDSFAVQGITYTKEDYNQDKDIINSAIDESGKIVISPEQQEKLSNTYKRSVNKNQQILQAANEFTGIKGISTVEQVQDYIVDKVNTMLQFIADDYGLPQDKYGKLYDSARGYNRQLDAYATKQTPMENAIHGISLEEQVNELRLAAYENVRYSIEHTHVFGRERYLVDWYKLGHPSLGKITSFTLTNKPTWLDKTVISNLQAHISSSTGNFVVYLTAKENSAVSTYALIDIAAE